MEPTTPSRKRPKLTPTEEGIAAELVSLIDSMTTDGKLTDEEIARLAQWFNDNSGVTLKAAMNRLQVLVAEILSDGRITDQERKEVQRATEAVLPPELRTVARQRRLAEYEAQKQATREHQEREREVLRLQRPLLQLDFIVAGVSHEGRDELVRKHVCIGHDVYLVRDPANQFDPNAICVVIGTGDCIGYVPRTDNPLPAKLLDSGVLQRANVKKILNGRHALLPVIEGAFYHADADVAGTRTCEEIRRILEIQPPRFERVSAATSTAGGCLITIAIALPFVSLALFWLL